MLTIAMRRSISTRTLFDPDFRARLLRDPRKAIAETFDIALPRAEVVEILEESAARWAFVLPALEDIEPKLPDPTDSRSAVENEVYALLRAEPDMIEIAARDPRTFLFDRFGIAVNGIDLRRERSGITVVVIPHENAREELSDEALDLVAGGGNQPTATKEETGSIRSL